MNLWQFRAKSARVILVSSVFLTLNAFASLDTSSDADRADQTIGQVSGLFAKRSPFLLSQVHVSTRTASILIESATDDSGEEITELRGGQLDLPVGSMLTIVEESEDGEYATVSPDLEGMMDEGIDVSEMPNLFKIKISELSALGLQMIQLTEIDGEESDFVIPEVVAGRKKGRAKMTYCLRDVRVYASSSCKTKIARVAQAAHAYNAYIGTGAWTKISRKNWKDYPRCTACFYGGGRQDCKGGSCGHAAIKIDANRWKGAGVRTVPGLPDRNGTFNGVRRKPYQFHGCLVPKKIGAGANVPMSTEKASKKKEGTRKVTAKPKAVTKKAVTKKTVTKKVSKKTSTKKKSVNWKPIAEGR